jgi:hypothetical protein
MGKSNKNKKNNNQPPDESLLSKNHSKSVRFRIRVQEEKEAEDEIKEYKDDPDGTERVS